MSGAAAATRRPPAGGRFPGFDVRGPGRDTGTRSTAGVVLARLRRRRRTSASSPRPRRRPRRRCATSCSTRRGEPRVPVVEHGRRPAGRGADRRLALRGHARGRRRPGGDTLAAPGRRTPRPSYGCGFAECPGRDQRRADPGRPGLGSGDWHGLPAGARVEPVDPVRLHRVLLPPVGLERDRLPRPGLPARLQEPRRRRAASRSRSPTPSPTRRPGARRTARDEPSVRDRNESAWLLPNDGTRHQPPAARGHAPVRRRRRGGPGHRRLRRGRRRRCCSGWPGRGWRVVAPGRRAVLGPGRRLGQRRGRLAPPVLDRAAGHRRRRPGAAGLEQLRPRRRRVDGALRRLHPALPPQRLPHLQPATGSAPTGRSSYAGPAALLRATSRPSCRSPGEHWPWGDPHRYPHRPHPVGGNGEIFLRGAAALRHHREGRAGGHHQRPVRQPAALHLPRVLPAGLQGQRQGVAADHPHPGRAGARRRGPRRLRWSPASRSTSAPAGPPGVHYVRDGVPALPAGRGWSRSPATRSRPRGCC